MLEAPYDPILHTSMNCAVLYTTLAPEDNSMIVQFVIILTVLYDVGIRAEGYAIDLRSIFSMTDSYSRWPRSSCAHQETLRRETMPNTRGVLMVLQNTRRGQSTVGSSIPIRAHPINRSSFWQLIRQWRRRLCTVPPR